MILLAAFWPGLAGAAVLGLGVGCLVGWPARPAIPLALCAASALPVAAALTGVVTGVPGLWLEGAALLLPAYIAGCATGAALRRLNTRG